VLLVQEVVRHWQVLPPPSATRMPDGVTSEPSNIVPRSVNDTAEERGEFIAAAKEMLGISYVNSVIM
jgi:hypothetical protein